RAAAEVVDIDVSGAIGIEGLVAIYTWEDLDPAACRPIPVSVPHKDLVNPQTPTALACEQVRYVGEPIAMVVAESRYAAEDVVARIRVQLAAKRPVSNIDQALEAENFVHDGMCTNVAGTIEQCSGDPEAAIEGAPH